MNYNKHKNNPKSFRALTGLTHIQFYHLLVMDDTVNDTVNEKEQEVLSLLKKQAGLNATEIAQRLGKSIPTIKRYLSSLSKLELIEFRGAPKTGGYYLK